MSASDRFSGPERDDLVRLERLVRVVEAFRTLEPSMPLSWVNAFLAVAMRPGDGPTQYARDCGTIQPIMSRILLELGPRSRKGGPGLQLIDRVVDDISLAKQRYFLTPKGRAIQVSILKSLRD